MNKIIKELIPYVIIIIVVSLIKAFIVTPVIVSGISMNNTLVEDDVLLLNIMDKSYNRGDIVVIKTEIMEDGEMKIKRLVKRVIALSGDTISCINGIVYVNGSIVEEEYVRGITYDFEEIKVPKDEYFVMGDNRMSSGDSRSIGTIPKEEIMGTVSFRIYPFNKIGKIK